MFKAFLVLALSAPSCWAQNAESQIRLLLGDDFLRAYGGLQPVVVVQAAPAERPSTGLVNPFEDEIQAAAKEAGLDPAVLRAVAAAKSNFKSDLVSGGAYGLMGLSRRTFVSMGFKEDDILDPKTNLRAGARILASLLKQFDGDVHRALAAYQLGAPAVRRSGGIPDQKDVRDFLEDYDMALRGEPRRRVKAVDPVAEIERKCRRSGSVACYRPLIEMIAANVGIDARLMEAMVMQENPQADPTAVSPRGAVGLGQLMPDTARLLKVDDMTNPHQNLRGMARHFKFLLGYYDGDRVLAVAAYNAGQGPVKTKIPRYHETMDYVRKICGNYYALTGVAIEYESYMPDAKPAVASR